VGVILSGAKDPGFQRKAEHLPDNATTPRRQGFLDEAGGNFFLPRRNTGFARPLRHFVALWSADTDADHTAFIGTP